MKNLILAVMITCLAVFLCAEEAPKAATYLSINGFSEDSVMQKAGALVDDIIIEYDGRKITNLEELTTARDKAEKDIVKVAVLREGKQINLSVPKGKLGVMLKEYMKDHEVIPDAKILQGYGKLDWQNETSNTFLACVALLEETLGAKTKYTDLIGLSGYGFRVHLYPGFCPSSPDATCGKNVGESLLSTLGYSYQAMYLGDENSTALMADPKQIPALREMIKKTIQKGFPLLAMDLIETPEWGLITGYQKDGTQYWCRTFFDKTKGYELAQKEPWVVYAVQDYKAADLKPAYGKSLKMALEMYQTKEYEGYRSGLEAYRFWIEQLQDEKAIANMTETELAEANHGNWWTFMSLLEARYHCAGYLLENKERFGTEVEKVEALSNLYTEEAGLLSQHIKEIPSSFDNPPRKWTQEDRNRQIEVLQTMLILEEKAVEILKSM